MPTSTAWRPDCETAVRALWDYLDRELPAPDMASIDAHLAVCERCRAHFAFERHLIEEIRAIRRQHDGPIELRRRVLEAIHRDRAAESGL